MAQKSYEILSNPPRLKVGEHVFEILETDTIPLPYEVWNIGSHNMAPGFLPLCRHKHGADPYKIDVELLKTIRLDGAGVILDAIGSGPKTPDEMEKFIAKHKGNPNYSKTVERMEAALPYMRQLKWPKTQK